MPNERQAPPYCVQIELTEGCNLRCPFCGVNGIRGHERTYKFMTERTAVNIAKSMALSGWRPRLEFAMHGEPTMHPDAAGIVNIFRRWHPQASILMLSNGGGLVGGDTPEKVAKLFEAGLNTLGLDEYEGITLVPRVIASLESVDIGLPDLECFVYPECGPKGNPHTRQPPSAMRLIHIKPISLSSAGTHASLNNHAGAGAPKNDRGMGKRCAKPFREISFRWDGSVAVCCNDWRGELALGNINNDDLDFIWNGPIIRAARRALYHGRRDFGPCHGCDALSYRPGLLPDHLGQKTLPKPTTKDYITLTEAAGRKNLAKTVKREWE